jgi:hypothetical protein
MKSPVADFMSCDERATEVVSFDDGARPHAAAHAPDRRKAGNA